MVNIVAEEEVVTELIQNEATIENVTKEAMKILSDSETQENLRARLLQVRNSLGEPGVLDRTAVRILEFLEERRQDEKVSI